MQETEITADLTLESFEKYLAKFNEELGAPSLKRRISFMVLERGNPLDNRVKITNGRPQLVQKIKSPPVNGQRTNQEFEVDLPKDVESIKKIIQILNNFYETYQIETLKLIVQHENYIWVTKDFELKLSHQFGNQSIYSYEIESLSNIDPQIIQVQLDIKADFDSFSEERRALRRGVVDIKLESIAESELDDIIKKYLSYLD